LSLVPARGEVIARLHPDDLTTVVEHGVGLPGREVALVADPAVERGGAVVEVGPCRIDAQVGPALGRVRSALGVALDGEVAS
jgi:flagellar assembly protein FliH